MIDIRYLRDCNGADRFGTCMGCGKGSREDQGLVRMTFSFIGGGTSVCVCNDCRKDLMRKIGEMEHGI